MLNKLSDGNVDVIFNELNKCFSKHSNYPEAIGLIYFKVFKSFCIDGQILNSSILSVNCLMITAFQRILGQSFFAPIITELFKKFKAFHDDLHNTESPPYKLQTALKSIISIITHFYLFESVTHTLISDVIKHLLKNFKEKDIEMLLNLLHNIGAMLRKDSPSLCKDIILLNEAKKVEMKINEKLDPRKQVQNSSNALKFTAKNTTEDVPLTPFERKVKFLTEELNDIKNNKVSRHSKLLSSLNLYLNWLKTNSKVKSELLKAPLDVSFEILENTSLNNKWWLSDEDKQKYEASVKINEIEKNIDKSYLSQLESLAKAQNFSTDIQKSVFYTLMNSGDYLDAFRNLNKLGLKKKQEREIVKVMLTLNYHNFV